MHVFFSESWNYFLSLFTHTFWTEDIFWVLILQKCIGSRYLVPLTPPSFLPIRLKLYMGFKDGLKICMWFFQNPEIIFYNFFRIFNLDIFLVLILQKCIGSRYLVPITPTSFKPILLKLYRCFKGGLKICMWFFQNPEIIFYHFLHILNLGIFWVLILQKSIGSRYLVPLSPPTVFGSSFWNFTWAFRMAWRYACFFFQNPEIIFITFSA